MATYQRQAVQSLLQSAKTQHVRQLALTRHSPKTLSGAYQPSDCRAAKAGKHSTSLFSCYAPIAQKRENYLPKPLMVDFMCPQVGHYSCVPSPVPEQCGCLTVVPEECFLVHVRNTQLLPTKEIAIADDAVKRGHRLELEAITKGLPRPV